MQAIVPIHSFISVDFLHVRCCQHSGTETRRASGAEAPMSSPISSTLCSSYKVYNFCVPGEVSGRNCHKDIISMHNIIVTEFLA